MMIQIPPIFERASIGSMKSKSGVVFDIVIGLDRALVGQLISYSSDDGDHDLHAHTSDRKRFVEGSYEEWFGKDRTPYALVSPEGDLAALAWFGPKPIGRKSLRYLTEAELKEEYAQAKGDAHTVVYRSYGRFRGQGLMTGFMRFAIDDYKARHPDAKLWAGVSSHNEASVALANKLGFIYSEEYSDPDNDWSAMFENDTWRA
jgi:RimJ/RimL family protein N-acetyltransferase